MQSNFSYPQMSVYSNMDSFARAEEKNYLKKKT